jgi:arsenate reductase
MKNKVYYNSKCSKCRIAKDYLENNNIQFSLIEYLKVGISKKDIKNILKIGNFNILDIIRKKEEEYKIYIKDKKLSENKIIDIVCKYPKLLQRPLIFNNKKALIARDEKSLNKIM